MSRGDQTVAKQLRLARGVTYRDAQGFEKAAKVIGTRASIKDGTDVTRPDEGNANLKVYSPKTGETYIRTNVPPGEGPNSFSL
jgi:hypothetical protein